MKQKFKNTKQQSTELDLAAELKKVKGKETHRTVILKYKDCCGCGCYWQKIKRVVPFDSPLKNGDKVEQFESDDEVI